VKCIDRKKIIVVLFFVFSLTLNSCSLFYKPKYDAIKTTAKYGITTEKPSTLKTKSFFQNSAVPKETSNIEVKDISHVYAAAAFNLTKNEALYGYNVLDKVYPASTTKILTALTAMKYGDLEKQITVSKNATEQIEGSSLAHLNVGDVLSLRQLLYGLMLPSGNDAAVAIAEGVAGSEKKFAKLMNKTAKELGATHSHFVTVSGLHQKKHYTTPYDIYLITKAAIANDTIAQVMSTTSYDAYYRDASNNPVSRKWTSTDQFAIKKRQLADGFTFVGGKTGTTSQAKYCLVLITENPNHEKIISIVYGADNHYNLYLIHNEILQAVG
jgi:D-alanyl-D-alanine carboxypeptidase (penicillin-binding protein 5/6)